MDNRTTLAACALVAAAAVLGYYYVDTYPKLLAVEELKRHPIYEKFKAMYPDAEEAYTLYMQPSVMISQQGAGGSTLEVHITKDMDPDAEAYYFAWCRPPGDGHGASAALEGAFDFLDSGECLQGP